MKVVKELKGQAGWKLSLNNLSSVFYYHYFECNHKTNYTYHEKIKLRNRRVHCVPDGDLLEGCISK